VCLGVSMSVRMRVCTCMRPCVRVSASVLLHLLQWVENFRIIKSLNFREIFENLVFQEEIIIERHH
jgi:hypothetical protein